MVPTVRMRRVGSGSSSSSKRPRRRRRRPGPRSRLLKRITSSAPRRPRWLRTLNREITVVPFGPEREMRWLPMFRVVSAFLVVVRSASVQTRSPDLRI